MRTPSAIARAGFTLVEVMIALLIGVIGIVVMMQTFSVSESFKRTATSGTDAQVNGAVALYMLEREIRLSGYGMNALAAQGCTSVRVWNNTLGSGSDVRMVPVEINPAGIPAGDANTDVLLIAYGNSDNFVAGLSADQASPTAAFTVYSNKDGFKNGDLFVTVMPGAGPGGTASCVMHEATAVPAAAGNCGVPPAGGANSLTHDAVTYKSAYTACGNVTATHNNSSGIKDSGGATVPTVKSALGGQIFNLGGAPSFKVYAIRGNNLTYCDMAVTDCTLTANYTIMVNDIVSLRAVYGMDFTAPINQNPGAGTAVPSRNVLTGNVYLPSRVLAVTLEVVARSSLLEKPATGTVCDATPVASRPDRAQDWLYQTGAVSAPIDLSATDANWSCYRHKLFQTSVPVRNNIWRP